MREERARGRQLTDADAETAVGRALGTALGRCAGVAPDPGPPTAFSTLTRPAGVAARREALPERHTPSVGMSSSATRCCRPCAGVGPASGPSSSDSSLSESLARRLLPLGSVSASLYLREGILALEERLGPVEGVSRASPSVLEERDFLEGRPTRLEPAGGEGRHSMELREWKGTALDGITRVEGDGTRWNSERRSVRETERGTYGYASGSRKGTERRAMLCWRGRRRVHGRETRERRAHLCYRRHRRGLGASLGRR